MRNQSVAHFLFIEIDILLMLSRQSEATRDL